MPQQTADIFSHREGSISFAVDAVTPTEKPRELKMLGDSLAEKLERPLLACSDSRLMIVDWDKGRIHPLIYAVFAAFSEHRPLCLRPDDIWLTIAQGFSNHVNQHAAALRERFVRQEGKTKLSVGTLLPPDRLQNWETVIPQWAAMIREQVIDPAIHDTLVCDFSTTTPTIRIASQIVLMEAFQQYFYYEWCAICGIPAITLYGSVDDWQAIRARVEVLAQYELDWWISRLLPICDALVATSQGEPPLYFWQAIFAPQEAYGGPVVKGWIADLFPYIGERAEYRNPLFAMPPGDWAREKGISPNRFPPGFSLAPVVITDLAGNEEHLELVGGFLGVSQEEETLALRPEIGWGIRDPNAAVALAQNTLAHTHRLHPPEADPRMMSMKSITCEWNNDSRTIYPELFHCPDNCTTLGELYRLCDGGTLFAGTDHPWLVHRYRDISLSLVDNTLVAPYLCAGCFTFIDLPDGRNIALAIVTLSTDADAQQETRVLLGHPGIEMREKENRILSESPTFPLLHYSASTTRVIAGSLDDFFDNIRRADGRYYFDSAGQ